MLDALAWPLLDHWKCLFEYIPGSYKASLPFIFDKNGGQLSCFKSLVLCCLHVFGRGDQSLTQRKYKTVECIFSAMFFFTTVISVSLYESLFFPLFL